MAEIGELKPCPFCGKRPVVQHTGTSGTGCIVEFRFRIRCAECGAVPSGACGNVSVGFTSTGEILIEEDGRKKAAGAWNSRAGGGIVDE